MPKLFGESDLHVSDDLRDVLALPARLGGLGLDNPVVEAPFKYADSKAYTKPVVELLMKSERDLALSEKSQEGELMRLRAQRRDRHQKRAKKLMSGVNTDLQRAMELAQEKGASAAFSTLPLKEYGFAIEAKRDYTDIVRMRYRMRIPSLPTTCSLVIVIHWIIHRFVKQGVSFI